MRSVWFSLVGPTVDEVENMLESRGFMRIPECPDELRYPSNEQPTLYVQCQDYQWVVQYDLQDEYSELLQAIGGEKPTAYVSADVSGRVPGDAEVRFLAQCILRPFSGFAFDDYLGHSHAWTLREIEEGHTVDGLHFFDYKGAWKQHLRELKEKGEKFLGPGKEG